MEEVPIESFEEGKHTSSFAYKRTSVYADAKKMMEMECNLIDYKIEDELAKTNFLRSMPFTNIIPMGFNKDMND